MTQAIFPEGFVWGTATSSYQIEGGWQADGKGESIWDRFSHTPGRVRQGHTGDVACDHYQRWPEDVALMKELGIPNYRFSINWPRILPAGSGAINEAGLDFYDRLVDGLLDASITPYITLYHWELPQALADKGGWAERPSAEAFVELADAVTRCLGDRVTHWITHNEPWCASFLSYQIGEHAPGHQNWTEAIRASHHLLLSHGWAIPVIRQNVPNAEVGITLNLTRVLPASAHPADVDAARSYDGYFNRWFLDPLYGRHYPADKIADYEAAGYLPNGLDFIHPGDMAVIRTATDFLGANYYTRSVSSGDVTSKSTVGKLPRTDIGWEIYPQGFYDLLNRLHFDYNVPKLYVTENGASYNDGPNGNGEIADSNRQAYIEAHLQAAHAAIQNGVPLAGYFLWSLMDNFEWGWGYTQRFGIVWVDFATQQRIPKQSALWYRQVIANNGLMMIEG
jgi:beta-glucosidase